MIQPTTIIVLASLVLSARAQSLLTQAQAWGYGILTGFGVSMIGFFAAILIVVLKKCIGDGTFKTITNLLYALGCGAMLGDAAIHILPESFTHEQANSNITSLILILAIVFFLIVERVFESCGIAHQHWGEHEHSHELKNTEGNQILNGDTKKDEKLNNSTQKTPMKQTKDNLILVQTISKSDSLIKVDEIKDDSSQEKEDQSKSCFENLKGKGSAGYLNLLSSFIHNFFDGLAIGIAFASRDSQTYIPLVIAVFAHEIPREIGDVGVLMKSGFSNTQTILTNGFINCFSLVGVVLGLGIGGLDQLIEVYVLTFVAGNFLYIAADIWRNLIKNTVWWKNILQLFAFSVGVGCMYLVLLAEQQH